MTTAQVDVLAHRLFLAECVALPVLVCASLLVRSLSGSSWVRRGCAVAIGLSLSLSPLFVTLAVFQVSLRYSVGGVFYHPDPTVRFLPAAIGLLAGFVFWQFVGKRLEPKNVPAA